VGGVDLHGHRQSGPKAGGWTLQTIEDSGAAALSLYPPKKVEGEGVVWRGRGETLLLQDAAA